MNKKMLSYKQYTLFKPLSEKQLLDVHTRTYKKNAVIHFESEVCSHVEVILSGQVAVTRIGDDGNLMVVADFHPDAVLGGNLVFSKNPHYPMTIIAKSDVALASLSKETLLDFCLSEPEFLKTFLQVISDNAMVLGDKIKNYVSRSIVDGVKAFLKNQYFIQDSTTLTLNITKKALAEQMGIQRTSLSRVLQKMKADGIIDYDQKTIVLLNLDAIL